MSAERIVFLFFHWSVISWVHTCCHLFEVTLVWDFVEDFQIPLSQVAYTETGDRALFCFLTEQRIAGVCCFHMDSVRGRYRHPTFLKLMSRKEMYILILLTKPISALPVKQSPLTEHSLWTGTPPSLSPLACRRNIIEVFHAWCVAILRAHSQCIVKKNGELRRVPVFRLLFLLGLILSCMQQPSIQREPSAN